MCLFQAVRLYAVNGDSVLGFGLMNRSFVDFVMCVLLGDEDGFTDGPVRARRWSRKH